MRRRSPDERAGGHRPDRPGRDGREPRPEHGDHGYTVAVFNRTTAKVDEFWPGRRQGNEGRRLPLGRGAGRGAQAAAQGDDHGQGRPAGRRRRSTSWSPTSSRATSSSTAATPTIPDTTRRDEVPEAKGLLFVGTGVSGGEEGARQGPVDHARAATPTPGRTSSRSSRRSPPRSTTGPPAATGSARGRRPLRQDGPQRHRVRRHAADLRGLPPAARRLLGLSADELHDVFADWNKGPLDSYLIEITRDILGLPRRGRRAARRPDPRRRRPEGDRQVDRRSRPLDLGMPLTLIAEAVFARCLSAQKDERVAASKVLERPERPPIDGDRQAFVDDIERPSTPKIISYAQGFSSDGRDGQGVELEDQQRRRRPDVAGRLHHPQRLPRQDQGGVRPQPGAARTCSSTPTSPARSTRARPGWRRASSPRP